MPAAQVTIFTDPHCPWSWGAEPAVRRVEAQFGERVAITYVMAGYARALDDPVQELRRGLDAAAASGMPVDGRLWLEHPPASSYPACLAVKAAAEQGRDGAYLRRARVAAMCERRRLDTADALTDLARGVDGLDVARFAVDLASNAIVEAFGADLERARAVSQPVLVPATWPESVPARPEGVSVVTPSYLVDGELVSDLAAAVRAVAGEPVAPPSVGEALRRFGPLAAAEVGAACDLPGPRAQAELWRLAAEWRVRAEPVAGAGHLWHLA